MYSKIPITFPISEMIMRICAENRNDPEAITNHLTYFIENGCDFYDVFHLLATTTFFNLQTAKKMLGLIPFYEKIRSPKISVIRGLIPRWTGTKYHTAPINVVLEEIQKHIVEKEIGWYVYNSNLNPYNPSAVNDPYLLIVFEDENFFFDFNRKQTYKIPETEIKLKRTMVSQRYKYPDLPFDT